MLKVIQGVKNEKTTLQAFNPGANHYKNSTQKSAKAYRCIKTTHTKRKRKNNNNNKKTKQKNSKASRHINNNNKITLRSIFFCSLETFLNAPSLKNHKSKVWNGNDRTTNCAKNFKGRRNTQYKRINYVHMFSTKAHRISMQVTNGEMMHPVVSLWRE